MVSCENQNFLLFINVKIFLDVMKFGGVIPWFSIYYHITLLLCLQWTLLWSLSNKRTACANFLFCKYRFVNKCSKSHHNRIFVCGLTLLDMSANIVTRLPNSLSTFITKTYFKGKKFIRKYHRISIQYLTFQLLHFNKLVFEVLIALNNL